ncbi:MAG TPA: type II toxin-antitoxin system VapC family toxin [Planctomycetota bacterium]|nr:type II toxin-antitoxin system VapC family toxin [Planctomycetota bacterium]HRR79714.1 type II toxin-antitoxin system VapC family toxin [Planctomycetota bacterium]HRT93217.1 type II toxin-antitoxin system VapC family toxin [Planctomycetota bacterium]
MKCLPDTHAWVWWHASPRRLSRRVRELIGRPGAYEELLLSAISPWEFAKLIEKGRLAVSCGPEEWVQQALRMAKLRVVPLTPRIACRSTSLPQPFRGDPADQTIVATAREEGATVLARDMRIRGYPHVPSLW